MAELIPMAGEFTIRLDENQDWRRAERILRAAVLTINDKAPLFDGPAPANTNQSDIANYHNFDCGGEYGDKPHIHKEE